MEYLKLQVNMVVHQLLHHDHHLVSAANPTSEGTNKHDMVLHLGVRKPTAIRLSYKTCCEKIVVKCVCNSVGHHWYLQLSVNNQSCTKTNLAPKPILHNKILVLFCLPDQLPLAYPNLGCNYDDTQNSQIRSCAI